MSFVLQTHCDVPFTLSTWHADVGQRQNATCFDSNPNNRHVLTTALTNSRCSAQTCGSPMLCIRTPWTAFGYNNTDSVRKSTINVTDSIYARQPAAIWTHMWRICVLMSGCSYIASRQAGACLALKRIPSLTCLQAVILVSILFCAAQVR